MATEIQLALIQLVALMVPAIGVYMLLFTAHSQAEHPLEEDTFYSAKYAALAFIGAAVLLVVLTVSAPYFSNLLSVALSGITVVFILAGLVLFGESIWSLGGTA